MLFILTRASTREGNGRCTCRQSHAPGRQVSTPDLRRSQTRRKDLDSLRRTGRRGAEKGQKSPRKLWPKTVEKRRFRLSPPPVLQLIKGPLQPHTNPRAASRSPNAASRTRGAAPRTRAPPHETPRAASRTRARAASQTPAPPHEPVRGNRRAGFRPLGVPDAVSRTRWRVYLARRFTNA